MLLGFKIRFAEPILDGTKKHTFRAKRKNAPKIGETLHMYSGLKTKHVKLISNKEKLISIQQAKLTFIYKDNRLDVAVQIDERKLSLIEILSLARYDGFNSISDWAIYWIESSTGKRFNKKKEYDVRGELDLLHWTTLRY